MDNMLEISLIIVLIFIAVYGVVSRICKCVETCTTTKAMATTYVKTQQNKEDENKEE